MTLVFAFYCTNAAAKKAVAARPVAAQADPQQANPHAKASTADVKSAVKKQGPSPIKDLERSNSKVISLIKAAGKKQSANERSTIKKEINDFLDFEALAKGALGEKHWGARSKSERSTFTTTLQGLIEANYIRQLSGSINFTVDYVKESIEGELATVDALFAKKSTSGKKESVGVAYKMHLKNGQWRVIDVITDDVSLVKNYRSQFNRIIRKGEEAKAGSGFSKLMHKMSSKLASMESST